jgi:peptidoglycan/xylan/chitin deacetylase (PgdA/CDA1 family)
VPATLYCHTGPILTADWLPNVVAHYLHQLAGYPRLASEIEAAFRLAIDPDADRSQRKEAARIVAEALGYDLDSVLASRNFAYMSASELREVFESAGVDVQLHTHTHTPHDMTEAVVRREIDDNVNALANMLGVSRKHFRHFCYPSGKSSHALIETLMGMGIQSAASVAEGLATPATHRMLLPRFIDGDNMHRIDFEAELSGFKTLLRNALGLHSSAIGYLPDITGLPQPPEPNAATAPSGTMPTSTV